MRSINFAYPYSTDVQETFLKTFGEHPKNVFRTFHGYLSDKVRCMDTNQQFERYIYTLCRKFEETFLQI